MSANPHANGGGLLQDLRLPDFSDYAVKVTTPGDANAEATRVQGQFIRDVIKLNPNNFRVFSPDETTSNRWNAVFEVTNRCSTAEITPLDDHDIVSNFNRSIGNAHNGETAKVIVIGEVEWLCP